MEIIDKLKENKERIVKITLSGTNLEIKKINIRPIVIKSKNIYQVERFVGNKVFLELRQ